MKTERLREPRGEQPAVCRFSGWESLEELREAILDLKDAKVEIEIEGFSGTWRFDAVRERVAFCEGVGLAGKREENWEGFAGVIDVVLARKRTLGTGATQKDVLADQEAINGCLSRAGQLGERVSGVVCDLIGELREG